jgi:general secretion pathway protein D
LANPRIRVLNREKASVMIGDKVPVITSTVNQNSNAITESISYLDVGLKLEVEPEIHIDNDVTMHVSLEVSNIIKEVRSSATGLLAYQIGTRNANTVLRLRDGETQVLAGLIKTDSQESGTHIPGLGKIPGLGRLFSNTNDTNARSEIVLLITPHVTRSLAVPGSYAQAFPSGTAEQVSARPLRLTPAAQYSDSDSLPAPVASSTDTAAAPPPVSGPGAAAIASTSVVHVSTDPTNSQGKTNSVRFDLAVPSQAASRTSFTVNLLANGPSFEKAELDLMLDQPEIQLLKVEARTGVTIDAKQDGNRVHISIGKAMANGSLAMITFQADRPSNGPLNLSLQNLKVENESHEQLTVTVALPKQILVSP